MISYDEANRLLSYDPETGIFRWKVYRSHNAMAGMIAGNKRNADGYIRIRVKGKFYYAHRLAWLLTHKKFPAIHIDHIDHDTANNRISNLRAASRVDNGRNRPLQKTNKTGLHGVFWWKPRKTWRAEIVVNNKNKFLGTYKDFFEAVCARKSAENQFNYHPNHGRA